MLEYHRTLLADRARTEAFGRAVMEVVRPGDTVLDLGCGTGILSLIACRMGARRVYAVEWGPIVQIAREVAEANGYGRLIEFIPVPSLEADFPERVDVIVAEILGSFGVEENVLTFLPDARDRALREGGTIVPRSLRCRFAPAEAGPLYDRRVGFWSGDLWDFDFRPVRAHAIGREYLLEEEPFTLLAGPRTLLDSETVALEPGVVGREAHFTVETAGTLHGVVGWFEAELTPGVVVRSGPSSAFTTWHPALLPVDPPVAVEVGDRVRIFVEAIPWGPEVAWNWEVSVSSGGREVSASCHSSVSGVLRAASSR